jgi:hypothetical protein
MAQLGRDGDLRGLVRVLEDASADDTTKGNAARALETFTAANEDNRAAVVAAGTIPLLVELLRGDSDEGRAKARGPWRTSHSTTTTTNVDAIMAVAAIPRW